MEHTLHRQRRMVKLLLEKLPQIFCFSSFHVLDFCFDFDADSKASEEVVKVAGVDGFGYFAGFDEFGEFFHDEVGFGGILVEGRL